MNVICIQLEGKKLSVLFDFKRHPKNCQADDIASLRDSNVIQEPTAPYTFGSGRTSLFSQRFFWKVDSRLFLVELGRS